MTPKPSSPELISVITVCRNAAQTIEQTLDSVVSQNYPFIEHCVIDAASTDGTVEILERYGSRIRWVSEPDKGIYDGMNKGIAMSRGSIIGFLNADDEFAHNHVLSDISHALTENSADVCYADVEFRNEQGKLMRRYDSSRFHPGKLAWGWMPAHPTLYVRKTFFDKVGRFRTDYQIAADYEWIIRAFSIRDVRWKYISDVWVHMKMGGASTSSWKSRWVLNREIVRACEQNGIKTSLFRVMMKIPMKLMELLKK